MIWTHAAGCRCSFGVRLRARSGGSQERPVKPRYQHLLAARPLGLEGAREALERAGSGVLPEDNCAIWQYPCPDKAVHPWILAGRRLAFAQWEGFCYGARQVNFKDFLNRDRVFRFMRFATVGASVAVIDCSGVALFSRAFPPLVAVTIAYFIAVCCHFLANKFWVFRCRRSDYVKQLFHYGVVILNNWLINLIVVSVCLSTFTHNVVIAKLCAIPCATMCNFLLMQLVVFRPHRPQNEVERLPYAQIEPE